MSGPVGLRAAEERGPGLLAVRIGVVALRLVAARAVRALPAADGGRDDDAVADLEVAYRRADLLDHPDSLVPEDRAGFHAGHGPADHVQVGPADGARGQADDRIGWLLDLRLRDVFEPDIPDPVENDGLHWFLLGLTRWNGAIR